MRRGHETEQAAYPTQLSFVGAPAVGAFWLGFVPILLGILARFCAYIVSLFRDERCHKS